MSGASIKAIVYKRTQLKLYGVSHKIPHFAHSPFMDSGQGCRRPARGLTGGRPTWQAKLLIKCPSIISNYADVDQQSVSLISVVSTIPIPTETCYKPGSVGIKL